MKSELDKTQKAMLAKLEGQAEKKMELGALLDALQDLGYTESMCRSAFLTLWSLNQLSADIDMCVSLVERPQKK